jgi:hypothetical protein
MPLIDRFFIILVFKVDQVAKTTDFNKAFPAKREPKILNGPLQLRMGMGTTGVDKALSYAVKKFSPFLFLKLTS